MTYRKSSRVRDVNEDRDYSTEEHVSFPSSFSSFCKRKQTRCKFILVSSDYDGAQYQGTGCNEKCTRKRR